jgi:hypothetical protein
MALIIALGPSSDIAVWARERERGRPIGPHGERRARLAFVVDEDERVRPHLVVDGGFRTGGPRPSRSSGSTGWKARTYMRAIEAASAVHATPPRMRQRRSPRSSRSRRRIRISTSGTSLGFSWRCYGRLSSEHVIALTELELIRRLLELLARDDALSARRPSNVASQTS